MPKSKVKVGDTVEFDFCGSVRKGIICYIYPNKGIAVGGDFDGWKWSGGEPGSEVAEKKKLIYGWAVDYGHYKLIHSAEGEIIPISERQAWAMLWVVWMKQYLAGDWSMTEFLDIGEDERFVEFASKWISHWKRCGVIK